MNELKLAYKFEPVKSRKPNIINEAAHSLWLRGTKMREEQIRVCLKPRPRWLPEFAWRWLVKRLIYVEAEVRA